MVLRAWRRALGLLMDAPGAVLKPNLVFSLILAAGLPLWVLAIALHASSGLLLLVKVLSAWWVWMAFSWLCFAEREGLESRAPGLKAVFELWWKFRAIERALSFWVVAILLTWIVLAHGFYQTMKTQDGAAAWMAMGANIVALLLGALLVLVQLPHFGISARKKLNWKGEWKAAWLMGLAFIPHCVFALITVILLSGFGALGLGMEHFLGRVLWVPALFLPVFGAGLIAAFLVCLSDELLARSLGLPAPQQARLNLKDWWRPWK